MRNYIGAANSLIQSGARVDLVDQNGRTPVDWAVLKNAESVIDLLVAHGADQPAMARTPVNYSPSGTSVLETGIKAVDLFAPLVRGGHNGILTPHSNAGTFVLLTELLLRMNWLYGSQTICLGLDDETLTLRDIQLLIRDAGISDVVSVFFGNNTDSIEQRGAMLKLAMVKAKDLRAQGKEVFFLVLNHIALYEDFLARLKATSMKDAGITTIYFSDDTAGAEPKPLADLDAVIAFD